MLFLLILSTDNQRITSVEASTALPIQMTALRFCEQTIQVGPASPSHGPAVLPLSPTPTHDSPVYHPLSPTPTSVVSGRIISVLSLVRRDPSSRLAARSAAALRCDPVRSPQGVERRHNGFGWRADAQPQHISGQVLWSSQGFMQPSLRIERHS